MKSKKCRWDLPGYAVFQDVRGVLRRSEFRGIDYDDSPGSEERILKVLEDCSDLSIHSPELFEECIDWPSLYHLSRMRSNVLRPFGDMLKGSVLEIGSGCGAITRFLGENGGEIYALEGTLRRAEITAARTRDLSNVTVIAESFGEFESPKKFDVVTLVGVLEYAGLFFEDAECPARAMLKHARKFLKPDGKLILAIENQLGLKYFAGYPEDHVGQLMFGVEGRYLDSGVQTYGRKALEALLTSSGFGSYRFTYPFPDYKFPQTFIFEDAFNTPSMDYATLAAQSSTVDPQLPQSLNFAMELAWRPLADNALMQDLSNSFVVIASESDCSDLSLPLAIHYTTDRRLEYCKQKIFRAETEDNKVSVEIKSLWGDIIKSDSGVVPISFQPKEIEPYLQGVTLANEMRSVMANENWDYCNLLVLFKIYDQIISSDILLRENDEENSFFISGDLFDIVPQNLMKVSDSYIAFDCEWRLNSRIDKTWIIARALFSVLNGMSSIGRPKDNCFCSVGDLLEKLINDLGLVYRASKIKTFVINEARIQSVITGRNFNSLIESIQKRLALPLISINRVNEHQRTIIALQSEISAIKNSRSWSITEPLRNFKYYKIKFWSEIKSLFSRLMDVALMSKAIGLRLCSLSFYRKLINSYRLGGLDIIRARVVSNFKRLSSDRNDYLLWTRYYQADRSYRDRDLLSKNASILKVGTPCIIINKNEISDEKNLGLTLESIRNQDFGMVDIWLVGNSSLQLFQWGSDQQGIASSSVELSDLADFSYIAEKYKWVIVVGVGSKLTPDSINQFSEIIAASGDDLFDVIYADEDRIGADGQVEDPNFRPNFNLLLTLAQGDRFGLVCYRSSIFASVATNINFSSAAWWFELYLSMVDGLNYNRAFHLPKILSHNAISAVNSERSARFTDAYSELIRNYFGERDLDVTVAPSFEKKGAFRLKFAVPSQENKVSIIIPTRDKSELLRVCLHSILTGTDYKNFEILIIDNGSVEQQTFDLFEEVKCEQVRIIRDDSAFNFSNLVNLGAQKARGTYLCLVNNDIEVLSHDWLEELLSHACLDQVGAVGARLWYPEMRLQHGGVILGLGGLACHAHLGLDYGDPGFQGRAVLQQELSAVTAACLMVNRSKFHQVGGFNPKLAVAFNDVDFCLRLKEAGYANVWTPYAELIHHESASRGQDDAPAKAARLDGEKRYMWTRWKSIIDFDPAYNPNLTIESEDFSLAWPPRKIK